RAFIQSKGLYGRVSVEQSDMKRLPYAENLVNLVVAEDLGALLGKGLALKEVFRVLTPHGALCFKGGADAGKLKATGFGEVRTSGAWTVAVKPRPAEMDDWPYFDYGPEGGSVSKDMLAGPMTSLRWRIPMYSKHCRDVVRGWVSAGGRMFYCRSVFTPDGLRQRIFLTARDAYNGQLLWRKRVVSWMIGDRNVLATPDRLYLPLEPKGPVVALDAATGGVVQTYEGTGGCRQVMLVNGKLMITTGSDTGAFDVKSGREVWRQRGIGGPFVFAEG
ncbi:unnamed protein product, partial [marine sediment metagenome]